MSFFGHPLLFAAVAVAAIGVVIYELLSGETPHRAGGRGGRGGRPPPPPDDYPYRPPSPNDSRKPPRLGRGGRGGKPPPPPDDYPSPKDSQKPPRPPDNSGEAPGRPPIVTSKGSETSDGSTVVPPNSPGNNLRRRNFYHASNKKNSSADSKNAVKDASATTLKKADEIPSTSSSRNSPDKKFDENNYSKNMLDKLTNDTKNINGNIKCEKFLRHNICEEESNSSESNEEKLINRNDENIVHNSKKPSKRKRKSKHAGFKPAQNITDKKDNSDRHQTELNSGSHSDDSVTFASTKVTKANKNETVKVQGSQSSNLYPEIDFNPLMSDTDKSSSCSDEDIYKEQLHETLMKDVYDSKENQPGCSVISSPKRIKEEKPIDSKICRGCEEKHVNTRAYPCNHSYLCVDCAVRIFRLYKKCTICLAHVEEFLQFSS